jgi:hypothetical protein
LALRRRRKPLIRCRDLHVTVFSERLKPRCNSTLKELKNLEISRELGADTAVFVDTFSYEFPRHYREYLTILMTLRNRYPKANIYVLLTSDLVDTMLFVNFVDCNVHIHPTQRYLDSLHDFRLMPLQSKSITAETLAKIVNVLDNDPLQFAVQLQQKRAYRTAGE